MSSNQAIQEPKASENDLYKQYGLILEKKIRNLEKRKQKLDDYRSKQKAGQELNEDQKTAVSHYNEVVALLETLNDLHKTYANITSEISRNNKKFAKKIKTEKETDQNSVFVFIVKMYYIYSNFANNVIKNKLLTIISENDLDSLLTFLKSIFSYSESKLKFDEYITLASEKALPIINYRSKSNTESELGKMKAAIDKLCASEAFDQIMELCKSLPPLKVAAINSEPISVEKSLITTTVTTQVAKSVTSTVPQTLQAQPIHNGNVTHSQNMTTTNIKQSIATTKQLVSSASSNSGISFNGNQYSQPHHGKSVSSHRPISHSQQHFNNNNPNNIISNKSVNAAPQHHQRDLVNGHSGGNINSAPIKTAGNQFVRQNVSHQENGFVSNNPHHPLSQSQNFNNASMNVNNNVPSSTSAVQMNPNLSNSNNNPTCTLNDLISTFKSSFNFLQESFVDPNERQQQQQPQAYF